MHVCVWLELTLYWWLWARSLTLSISCGSEMLEKVHNGSIDGTLSAKDTWSYTVSGTDHNAIVESLDPMQRDSYRRWISFPHIPQKHILWYL